MGPRPVRLAPVALLAVALLAGCGGDSQPDPVPSPSPTSTPTGDPVTDESRCTPITAAPQVVTVPLSATAPLPDGGAVRVAEVTPKSGSDDASVVLEVVRKVPGCPADAFRLDLLEGAGASVRGVQVDVIAVTSGGGMPPAVQLRIGPGA